MPIFVAGMPFSASPGFIERLRSTRHIDATAGSDDRSVGQINHQVLNSVGASWSSYGTESLDRQSSLNTAGLFSEATKLVEKMQATHGDLWFASDPQFAFTLNFWHRVFAELDASFGVLVIARDPRQVVESLVTNAKLPLDHANQLWRAHHEQIAAAVSRHRIGSHLVIDGGDTPQDWDTIEAFLDDPSYVAAESRRGEPLTIPDSPATDVPELWRRLVADANGPLDAARLPLSTDLAAVPSTDPSTVPQGATAGAPVESVSARLGRGTDSRPILPVVAPPTAEPSPAKSSLGDPSLRQPPAVRSSPDEPSFDESRFTSTNHAAVAASTSAPASQPSAGPGSSMSNPVTDEAGVDEPSSAPSTPMPADLGPGTSSDEPTLTASIARSWKWALAAMAAVIAALVALNSTAAPTHVAQTSVILRDPVGGVGFNVERYIADQVNIFASRTIAAETALALNNQGEQVGFTTDEVDEYLVVDGDPFSNKITLTFASDSPDRSAAVVNTTIESYEAFVVESQASDAEVIEASFADLLADIDQRLTNTELTSVEQASLNAQRADLLLRINEFEATSRINADPFALRQQSAELTEEPALPLPLAIALGFFAAGIVAAATYVRDRLAWNRRR